jgi:hypothetical protein
LSTYALTHLPDDVLLNGFAALATQDRKTTAALLAHIAEIDARHLYLRAGFESMRAYCVHELHLSEDGAAKRLQVARLARELPALFPAIADGRLHMRAVRALAPRLTPANVDEWIAAAANKTVSEIEVLIAHQFPQPERLRLDDGISPQVVVPQRSETKPHAPGHADFTPGHASEPAPAIPMSDAAAPIAVAPRVRTKIAPLSPERYTLQVTLPGATHDKLRRAQELLGHAVPSGDVAQVLDRALDALLGRLEKRKFGLAAKPRAARPAAHPRSIHAQIRHAVYKRDGGRCVFIGEEGRRCGSRSRLEFDHVLPLARGGRTTIANLRLLCRAHNLHAAERAFGRDFMQRFRN